MTLLRLHLVLTHVTKRPFAALLAEQVLEAPAAAYSTVTLLAKLRGLSTSQPRATAM